MRGWRYSAAAVLSVLLIWQTIIWFAEPPRYILPAPVAVFLSFIDNVDLIFEHALVTLTEVFLGLLIGISFGVATALHLETSKSARLFVRPLLVFSQALPVFALAPVLTLWLGYGMTSKVVMAILIIYFPVTSAFHDGLSRTPKRLLDLAKVMQASTRRTLFFIKVPAAMPSLFSGIRLAAVYAPIGATIGEWVGSSQGLGYLMLLANGRVKTDLMFAALLTLGFISMSLYGLTGLALTRLSKRYGGE
ncbi:ABC transporter permease [Terasakiella pusilla]|uniref:ABC transporter permease n=1 Tax=Terasakiella pusilla TaxID=64973 RepID=UPI003AA93AAC